MLVIVLFVFNSIAIVNGAYNNNIINVQLSMVADLAHRNPRLEAELSGVF